MIDEKERIDTGGSISVAVRAACFTKLKAALPERLGDLVLFALWITAFSAPSHGPFFRRTDRARRLVNASFSEPM